jgi:acyl-coenzyme A synthetase/AMP-(fatty) acid ligase
VPREIEFVDALPMTTTGKIQHRTLREAERAKLPPYKSTIPTLKADS